MLRLIRFARISLSPGEEKTVTFSLDDRCFTLFTEDGKEELVHGTFKMYAGGSLPTVRSLELGAAPFVNTEISV